MPVPMPDPFTPLRFAIVSTQRNWNGGENQAGLLAEGLRRRGHNCQILARRGGKFAERMQLDGFDTVTFAGRGLSPAGLRTIRKALGKIPPDVIFSNDSHALTSSGIAGIGRAHGLRIAARRVDFPLKSPWQYRLFADRVVCISHSVERACLAAGLEPQRLRRIYSGVDPQRVVTGDRTRGRAALQLAGQQPLVLCVGSLSECKGQFYLLESLAAVVRRHPSVCLALAGDGKMRDALETFAKNLGIAQHVRFLGYRHDIPDLLAACDLFVLPSVSEGLGTSVIDAMLAERPIVTTTSGGLPELVGSLADGPATAWLVPPRSREELTAAINAALDDSETCRRLAARSHGRALAMFTADKMVEGTLDLCREMMAVATQQVSAHRASFSASDKNRAA